MFTGIVSHIGKIVDISPLQGGIELKIEAEFASSCHIDESIAVNGVCQTVTAFDTSTFTVQAVEETLRKTTFPHLNIGDEVNLERSLTLQQGIEGHLVQGHVDTVGRIIKLDDEGANWIVHIEYPESFTDLIVARGSITVDGISLTIAECSGNTFKLAIIPYTWEHTILRNKKKSSLVNLEFDILGKYVVNYMKRRAGEKEPDDQASTITKEWLSSLGY